MSANSKETAEQKLLKMLEASGGTQGAAVGARKKTVKKKNVLGLIKTANKLLIVGLLIGIGFFVLEILSGMQLMGENIDYSVDEYYAKRSVDPTTLIPHVEKFSYYISYFENRNIFRPFEERQQTDANASAVEQKHGIASRTSNLKLVGVSWLDSVESASVMIEDREKGITYFLKKGEKIDDIIVKTIYADSVLVGYQNEEMIIKYDKPKD